jgi:NAD(P)H-nitrite reductase large subunit
VAEPVKTRYAIVGAGVAGIAAAEAIREVDPAGEILLINGEQVPPYCRPLIVEVLKRERSFDGILLREPGWFKEQRVSLITGDRAVGLSTNHKRIELESGRVIEWEKLLVAAGSKPVAPPIDGLENVPAFTLYRQDDVECLKPLCVPGAKALLVGIGLIGLQAITALRKMGLDVVAVERMDRVLPMVLETAAAKYAQQRLEANGVEVRVGTSIRELRPAPGAEHKYVAVTDDGTELQFDFLISATGLQPEFSLLHGSDIRTNRGIEVSLDMETSVPGIYAAGDITEYPNWIEGRPEVHAHWVNAYRQGRIAGYGMAGRGVAGRGTGGHRPADGNVQPYEPVFLNSLNVFGLPIIAMGASRVDAPADAEIYVSEEPARSAYARLVVKDARVIAATFVNDVDRAGVFQYLLRAKVDIGAVAESLFEESLAGLEFLDRLHDGAVRGDVDWPESMDLIERYRKDHTHTRWGSGDNPKKR